LGSFKSRVNNRHLIFVVPCRNPSFANRINEDAESWFTHNSAYTPGQVWQTRQAQSTRELSIRETFPHTPPDMSSVVNNSGLARYWYGAAIADFLASDADDILGKLSRHAGDGHFSDQRDAWLAQI